MHSFHRKGARVIWLLLLVINSDGDDWIQAKMTPPPCLGLPTKTQQIPGPKINPPKISCQICEPWKFLERTVNKFSDCFGYTKNPYLQVNQATHKILAKFPYQKRSQNQNFQPPKIFWLSSSLEIWGTLPGSMYSPWGLHFYVIFGMMQKEALLLSQQHLGPIQGAWSSWVEIGEVLNNDNNKNINSNNNKGASQ